MGARILTLQRQARELGRLRTGFTDHSGDKPRPVKSATWVVSSHAEHYVAAAAELWGGRVEKWKPLGDKPEQYRVITQAASIDALMPPGDPLSQYNEMWNKGGVTRRCDGVTENLSGRPCLCLAQYGEDWHLQSKKNVCAATTRLNVMLPDMPDLGVWRAETKSFYAANEWAATADMVHLGSGGKGLVPISMRIEPRERVAGGTTKRFPVVVVEIRGVTTRQALTGPLPTALALDPGTAPALELEAGRPDYEAEAAAALTPDDVGDVYRRAHAAGHLDDALIAHLTAVADRLKAEAAGPDQDGAYPAEVIEETSR